MVWSREKIEELELDMLLKAVDEVYGFDFSHYSRAHIKRRLQHLLAIKNLPSLSALAGAVLHDPSEFKQLLNELSIRVTEMFRDPGFYRSLRENVIPVLKTYPYPKIWVAGCATGEEVYSLAILLKESGLLDRTQIFATDFNESALETAKKAEYPIDKIKSYTLNYQKAEGVTTFSDYYQAYDGFVKLDEDLKKNITFSLHNLDKDAVFAKVNMVVCRNVMIYFDKFLQNKVTNLFYRSLTPGGFLALGMKESLLFSDKRENFKAVDADHKIFKKKLNL
jgi:chemotaxis protein methyltransferase CheR